MSFSNSATIEKYMDPQELVARDIRQLRHSILKETMENMHSASSDEVINAANKFYAWVTQDNPTVSE